MRPLLGALAVSLSILAAGQARAADTAPSQPVSQALTPQMVAASLAPDFMLKATLYHAGAAGVGNKDSIGCRPVAMRTAATDPRLIPRRTVLFIADTVGLPMPGGGVHDGFWYASDVGGAIKGNRIDLYTGNGRGSMAPIMRLNLQRLKVARAGAFRGCPVARGDHAQMLVDVARRSGITAPSIAVIDLLFDQWRHTAEGLIKR